MRKGKEKKDNPSVFFFVLKFEEASKCRKNVSENKLAMLGKCWGNGGHKSDYIVMICCLPFHVTSCIDC
jgi:hypothetical protein